MTPVSTATVSHMTMRPRSSCLSGPCWGRQYNPVSYAAAGGAANQLFAPITPAGGWGMETVLTFALVFMVLSATDSERAVDAPHLPVRTWYFFSRCRHDAQQHLFMCMSTCDHVHHDAS